MLYLSVPQCKLCCTYLYPNVNYAVPICTPFFTPPRHSLTYAIVTFWKIQLKSNFYGLELNIHIVNCWCTYKGIKESSWHLNFNILKRDHLQHNCSPPVSSSSSISMPPSYYAFIPIRKNLAHISKMLFLFFNFLSLFFSLLFQTKWIWNCITLNCVSQAVSVYFKWQQPATSKDYRILW
jgi:hypothetical protein